MGLFKRLGSFGSRIWDTIKRVADPIRSAFDTARQADVSVSVTDIVREYRKAIKLEGLSAQIATLSEGDYIPAQLHQESEIPWNRPFAYEVTMSGRDLATGRFARTSRVLTFSRQMTVGEIEDEALGRFGGEGAYPQMDVTHVSVTAAEFRAGEQDRLW